jgi:hypothetical protein
VCVLVNERKRRTAITDALSAAACTHTCTHTCRLQTVANGKRRPRNDDLRTCQLPFATINHCTRVLGLFTPLKITRYSDDTAKARLAMIRGASASRRLLSPPSQTDARRCATFPRHNMPRSTQSKVAVSTPGAPRCFERRRIVRSAAGWGARARDEPRSTWKQLLEARPLVFKCAKALFSKHQEVTYSWQGPSVKHVKMRNQTILKWGFY